jgi:hypothetical protein
MKRKACPYCGAKGTNRGRLGGGANRAGEGRETAAYHGYACRTFTYDDTNTGPRSPQCLANERDAKRP